MSENAIKLLQILAQSSTYLTSFDLEKLTGIKQRTIRDEMRSIRRYLKKRGFELIAVRSKGYLIRPDSGHSLEELEQDLMIERARTGAFTDTTEKRADWIAVFLIETGNFVLLDDLADELLVSRSTAAQDLKIVRHMLAEKGLELESVPGRGIRAAGDERIKRAFICDYIFGQTQITSSLYDFLVLPSQAGKSLEQDIVFILKKYQIPFFDLGLIDLFINLAVALGRSARGFRLPPRRNCPELPQLYRQAAQETANAVKKRTGLELNEAEIEEIGLEIASKTSELQFEPQTGSAAAAIAEQCLQTIQKKWQLTLEGLFDSLEFQGLIQQILLHMTCRTKCRTTIYSICRSSYVWAYELAICCARIIEARVQGQVGKSDLASLASFFHMIKIQAVYEKTTVYLMGGENRGNIWILRHNLISRHSRYIKEIHWLSSIDAAPEAENGFIISTIPLPPVHSLPAVYISSSLNARDHERISRSLHSAAVLRALPFYALGQEALKLICHDEEELLTRASAFLGAGSGISSAILIRSMEEGLRTSGMDYKNGLRLFAFYNEMMDDSFFYPVHYPDEEQVMLIVSLRPGDDSLYQVLHSILGSISRTQVKAIQQSQGGWSALLRLLKETDPIER